MSIYQIKPKFQNLLRPLVNLLAAKGVTANQITILAIFLSALTGFSLCVFPNRFMLFLVPIVLFLRMALNAIDGMLAKEHDMKTPLGAILNELGDVLSDTALYLPFAFILTGNGILIVSIVIFSIISEMTGVLGVFIDASRRYDGPMGKSDRAFCFGLLSLLIGMGVPTGQWVSGVFFLVLVLVIITIFNRVKNALSEVKAL